MVLRILASDGKCGGADVDGRHGRLRQVLGERHRDDAAAGADVGDRDRLRRGRLWFNGGRFGACVGFSLVRRVVHSRLVEVNGPNDEQLGLGARD
jgi:hypothetical protein